nr:DUF5077 domain-containing protein [Anseongella ginsenosidimutans]
MQFNIKRVRQHLLPALFLCGGVFYAEAFPAAGAPPSTDTVTVPLGGNTWQSPEEREGGRLTNEGIREWSDGKTTFTTYVRLARKGSLKIGLNLSVPSGSSKLEVIVQGRGKEVSAAGSGPVLIQAGEWRLRDTGYLAITLKGLSRTGEVFADVSSIVLEGTAVNGQIAYVKNNEGNFFYWGRRGPSVHMSYPVPGELDAEWFYNEVTVPEGEDVQGSYFMATGFAEGYFGFQVNSPGKGGSSFPSGARLRPITPKTYPKISGLCC